MEEKEEEEEEEEDEGEEEEEEQSITQPTFRQSFKEFLRFLYHKSKNNIPKEFYESAINQLLLFTYDHLKAVNDVLISKKGNSGLKSQISFPNFGLTNPIMLNYIDENNTTEVSLPIFTIYFLQTFLEELQKLKRISGEKPVTFTDVLHLNPREEVKLKETKPKVKESKSTVSTDFSIVSKQLSGKKFQDADTLFISTKKNKASEVELVTRVVAGKVNSEELPEKFGRWLLDQMKSEDASTKGTKEIFKPKFQDMTSNDLSDPGFLIVQQPRGLIMPGEASYNRFITVYRVVSSQPLQLEKVIKTKLVASNQPDKTAVPELIEKHLEKMKKKKAKADMKTTKPKKATKPKEAVNAKIMPGFVIVSKDDLMSPTYKQPENLMGISVSQGKDSKETLITSVLPQGQGFANLADSFVKDLMKAEDTTLKDLFKNKLHDGEFVIIRKYGAIKNGFQQRTVTVFKVTLNPFQLTKIANQFMPYSSETEKNTLNSLLDQSKKSKDTKAPKAKKPKAIKAKAKANAKTTTEELKLKENEVLYSAYTDLKSSPEQRLETFDKGHKIQAKEFVKDNVKMAPFLSKFEKSSEKEPGFFLIEQPDEEGTRSVNAFKVFNNNGVRTFKFIGERYIDKKRKRSDVLSDWLVS